MRSDTDVLSSMLFFARASASSSCFIEKTALGSMIVAQAPKERSKGKIELRGILDEQRIASINIHNILWVFISSKPH
jgi:hypothetical protein